MSFRMITTCFAMLVFTGGFLAAGCGGSDSPTSPPTTQPTPPPPTPPPPTVSSIEVSPNTVTLEVGRTQAFVATAKASDGSVIGGVNFTWSSSNTAVLTISSGGVVTAVSGGTATIRATGNGITSAPATITVTVPPVSSVTVSPSSAQDMMVGEMTTFTATARTAGGAVRGDVSISWSSSDTSVVTITSAGVATAVAAGTASIRAAAGGVTSSPVTINVAEPPPPEPVVSKVTVSPASMMMMVGGMFQFTAVAMTADGMVIDDVDFAWLSDDTEVAKVDETGLVTAVAAGTAMITASADSVTSMPATVTVEESAPVIASVTIMDAIPVMLEVGDTHQLMAVARTSEGTVIDGVAFEWSSDDNEVATVDSTGLITAVAAGMAEVTAMAEEVTSEPVSVTVAEPPPVVDRVTVEPPSASIEEGETRQFSAMALTSDGMEIQEAEFTWLSSDEMVATVDATGLATGVGAGEAMITATADSVSGMATLTVAEPPPPEPVVSTVTVSPASMMMMVGGMFQFTAVAMTADGMVIDDVDFAWLSDDTEVAKVDETGLVTAVAAGTAMITASADSVTSMPATVTVEESAPVIASVTIMDAIPVMLEVGDTHQLMAVARTSEGTVIDGVAFEWSSDDNEVATVDSTGLITAVAAGMAEVTAMAEEVTSEPISVTVAEPPPVVDRVTVGPPSASIEEGETQQFTATAYDSDNEEISGKTFRWTSSRTSVATVSPSSGSATTATGVNAGSTTIRAAVDGKSGTATLTVTAPPPPPPPPPTLKSRTGTISGSYSAAGTVVLSEVAGGQLRLTITGLRSTAPDTWLALSENPKIDWAVGESLPNTARSFGEVTGKTSFTSTFTPPSGKDIDSYDYVILYCRAFDLRISSNPLSN